MRQFDCPQCGAPVVFQSSTAEASVCSFCQSMVVRKDFNVEVIGKMAVLPPDVSPLQIGAKGRLGEWGFVLLGRMRVAWEGGSWNEWYAEFFDGGRGWVAEAQGFFMLLREEPIAGLDKELTNAQRLTAGKAYMINGEGFKVTDSKQVRCLGGEGELPTPVMVDETWQSTDLENNKGEVATLERAGPGWRFFKGHAATFAELDWQNLREMPGWNGVALKTERGMTEGFNCPSCGGVVTMRASGMSMAVTCSHCQSVLDTTLPNVSLLQKAKEKRRCKPVIPLGARGVLKGVEWEVIGFMRRRDQWASWMEYLLFNPFQGYLWLTEYKGHWIVVDRLVKGPTGAVVSRGGRPWVQHGNREYRRYASAKSEVTYVEGEFYWLVQLGEKATVADYISPPYVLSSETYEGLNEVTWSHGEYATSAQLSEAFKMKLSDFPGVEGQGMIQPNAYEEKWSTLKPLIKWVAIIFLGLQIFTGWSCSNPTDYKGKFAYEKLPPVDATGGATLTNITVSPPFEITKRGGVEVEVRAPVNNSWLGLDVELVNQQTGERLPGEVTVEYYHGVDSDGRWEEGNTQARATIPGVKPGTYTLTLDPAGDAKIENMEYSVEVTSGHRYFSNFVLGLLALMSYPLYVGWRHASFEGRRWADAD